MKELAPLPHPLPDALVELIARRFQAIGEPMRIRIPDRLCGGEQTVGELAEAIGGSQQNMSKHLTLLAEAGIVARRKDGTRVHYRIADETVLALCEQVCGGLRRQVSDLHHLLEGAPS
jgi:DNA-binding transcriptional ArsR family regulator